MATVQSGRNTEWRQTRASKILKNKRSHIRITQAYGITQEFTAHEPDDKPGRGTLGLTEFRHKSRAPSRERGTSATTL